MGNYNKRPTKRINIKKFMKKTWLYWLAIIVTEVTVLGIVIGIDYAITNNIPELQETTTIGNYTFTYEIITIIMVFTTMVQIINSLIYSLWEYLFKKILEEYKNARKE